MGWFSKKQQASPPPPSDDGNIVPIQIAVQRHRLSASVDYEEDKRALDRALHELALAFPIMKRDNVDLNISFIKEDCSVLVQLVLRGTATQAREIQRTLVSAMERNGFHK